ncbi:MAG: hypothetical protein IH624_08435 [Phycisphaerae bacterium]|nr:hypothetical protein [Phycisphaerae bacterium]
MGRHYILVSVLSLGVLVGHGCVKEPPYKKEPVSDVAKTNEVRKELGIREVKDDWEFCGHRFGEDTWKYGAFECKKVKLNEELDRILWEQDYYYTGVTWTDIDGTNREFLAITYDYNEGVFFVVYNGQQAKLDALQNRLASTYYGFMAETNEETLRIADEMLAAIGKSRLD